MEQLLKAEQRLQVERMIRCSCQENNLGELLELDIITNIDVNGSPQYKVKKLKR